MSPDYMTSGWYYAKAGAAAGNEIGPLSWEELYLLAHGGTLAPADIVWNPRLPRGVTAGLVPGLFAAPMAPQATPVQPAPSADAATRGRDSGRGPNPLPPLWRPLSPSCLHPPRCHQSQCRRSR